MPGLKANEFLKMYMQGNDTHELDRERASSLVKNIKINKDFALKHPFFNRKPTEEPHFNLDASHLY